MKLETEKTLEAQSVQILSNSIRLQALLETLIDLKVIKARNFNDLVDIKFKELNDQLINEMKSHESDTDIDDIIKKYGSVGDA